MRSIWIGLLFTSVFVAGCARDQTITRGADGQNDWNRRLTAAVPIGMSAVAARALMERNGFQCQFIAKPQRPLWCEKHSDSRLAGIHRRWQATFQVQDEHIVAVRASTGLVRP